MVFYGHFFNSYRLHDLQAPGDGSSSERETMSSIMRLALSTSGLGYIMIIEKEMWFYGILWWFNGILMGY